MSTEKLEKALLDTVDTFEKDLAFTAPEMIFMRIAQLRGQILDIMDELREGQG